jgi:hypothetical protein
MAVPLYWLGGAGVGLLLAPGVVGTAVAAEDITAPEVSAPAAPAVMNTSFTSLSITVEIAVDLVRDH